MKWKSARVSFVGMRSCINVNFVRGSHKGRNASHWNIFHIYICHSAIHVVLIANPYCFQIFAINFEPTLIIMQSKSLTMLFTLTHCWNCLLIIECILQFPYILMIIDILTPDEPTITSTQQVILSFVKSPANFLYIFASYNSAMIWNF